jgi:hypothetical protein
LDPFLFFVFGGGGSGGSGGGNGGGGNGGGGGSGGDIKRDKTGAPLNFGNYMTGELQTKKPSGGGGGGGGGSGGGGGGGGVPAADAAVPSLMPPPTWGPFQAPSGPAMLPLRKEAGLLGRYPAVVPSTPKRPRGAPNTLVPRRFSAAFLAKVG